MSKDQWIADYARVFDDVADDKLERDDAIGSLMSLGLTKQEGIDQLDEVFDFSTTPPTTR